MGIYRKMTNDSNFKLFVLIGVMVFGGMALTSIIDADYYSKKNQLTEYRLFILIAAAVYYGCLAYIMRQQGEKE